MGQMIVAAAPYGGPIAMVRDWRQFVKASTAGKPVIRIFTCAGKAIDDERSEIRVSLATNEIKLE